MRKTINRALFSAVCMSVFCSTATAYGCSTEYMKDPCATGNYDVVETEKFIKGSHNYIHDVHYFNQEKKQVKKKRKTYVKKRKKKRVARSRYKYIKKCRLVKIKR